MRRVNRLAAGEAQRIGPRSFAIGSQRRRCSPSPASAGSDRVRQAATALSGGAHDPPAIGSSRGGRSRPIQPEPGPRGVPGATAQACTSILLQWAHRGERSDPSRSSPPR
jgi:hypothetical protein